MKTSKEYIERLNRMKKNVYVNGKIVERTDSMFRPGINAITLTFDAVNDPEFESLLTAKSHISGETINRFTHIHQSVDDLLKKQECTRLLCRRVGGCMQRCMGIDAMNALSIVTWEADQDCGTNYYDNFVKYLRYFQENDLVAASAQTDVKGDRMLRPSQQKDPDLYVRCVEKRKDGIVVSGAKANITISPYADEIIVVPTRAMKENEGDWSVAFAVPADTEGVYLSSRPSIPRPRETFKATYNEYGSSDSVVILDNVFVPWERVFLCGETRHATRLAALFATYHRHSYTGCKPAITDIMIGSSALVAEYNGIAKASHVKDKLAHLISVAELVFGVGVASGYKSERCGSGTYLPNIMYTNVGRYHAGTNIYHEYETLCDLAGGLVATLPLEGDFTHEKIGPLLNKYILRKDGISAEDQHRCFRFISDMIVSSHGGLMQIAGVHGGGSPVMEQIAILANYDLEKSKKISKKLAGIKD